MSRMTRAPRTCLGGQQSLRMAWLRLDHLQGGGASLRSIGCLLRTVGGWEDQLLVVEQLRDPRSGLMTRVGTSMEES